LPGTLNTVMNRCGKSRCACHADPPRLHGPYWQWTRKVAAKTVCRWLSADQQQRRATHPLARIRKPHAHPLSGARSVQRRLAMSR